VRVRILDPVAFFESSYYYHGLLVLLGHKSEWTVSAAEGFAEAALYAGEV
jgi:hypothetical protein